MTPVLVILFHVNPPRRSRPTCSRRSSSSRSAAACTSAAAPSTGARALVGGRQRPSRVRRRLRDLPRRAAHGADDTVKHILGWVLLVAAAGMLVKIDRADAPQRRCRPANRWPPPRATDSDRVDRRYRRFRGRAHVGRQRLAHDRDADVPVPDAVSAREMVGTDLVQAIPLVASAAIGHLIFGDLAVRAHRVGARRRDPGVYVGARISATASDRFIRPALIAVLTSRRSSSIGASNAVLLGATIVFGGRDRGRTSRSGCPAPPAPTQPETPHVRSPRRQPSGAST